LTLQADLKIPWTQTNTHTHTHTGFHVVWGLSDIMIFRLYKLYILSLNTTPKPTHHRKLSLCVCTVLGKPYVMRTK